LSYRIEDSEAARYGQAIAGGFAVFWFRHLSLLFISPPFPDFAIGIISFSLEPGNIGI
jgi:hypothetical protein